MINTAFPNKILSDYSIDYSNYVLSTNLQKVISEQNHDLITKKELRLQNIFTIDIWNKIESLNLLDFNWSESTILDVASGSGFLSYHLLQKISPKKIVLSDISPSCIDESRKLFASNFPSVNADFKETDVLKSGLLDNSFDVVIGNSFIHHFYNVPEAFDEFYRLLKPGGIFISLHEPTPAAVALESGSFLQLFLFLVRGKKYISDIRNIKGDFSLDNNIGGDVWLLENKDMERILLDRGFDSVITKNHNLFRAFIVGLFNWHVNEKRQSLNSFQIKLLRAISWFDKKLELFLPTSAFSSMSICAKKIK